MPSLKSVLLFLRGAELTPAKSRYDGLGHVFQPSSIAIIGASSDYKKTGGRPVHLLLKHGFPGEIYPVNPKAKEIQGLPAFVSVSDIPQTPELIVVAVPGAAAVDALEAAADRGVGAAIVLSSGFSESGPEGAVLQERVIALAARSGMRVVGPNCLGTISVKERAIGTFSVALENEMPREGGISIVSQSGNIGSAALRMLGDSGAGVARFIATGNEADVHAGDAIGWLANDPDTKVILCCLETCRDAERLTSALELARQAGKPVIALKIGTSEVGKKATLSHTGGLAGSDRVFDALFAKYGAVRVGSLEELVQVGAAVEVLGNRKIGASPSSALIAASGGFCVMMADAAETHNVAVNPMGQNTRDRINKILPFASPINPIDATAQMSASPDALEELVEAALVDPANSTVCLMLALGMEVPRLRTIYTAALSRVTGRHPDKILVACIAGPTDAIRDLRDLGIVCFPTIEATLSGIASLGRIEKLHDQNSAHSADIEVKASLDPEAWRNEATAKAALSAAGLPFLEEFIASNGDEAARAAEQIGGPVVLKILSPDIQHKSDIGGVELNIDGAKAAQIAFERIIASVAQHAPEAVIDGVLISPMATGGTELILGAITDAIFGPVVVIGLGGMFAEIFDDTALRIAPVTMEEAGEMLCDLKAYPLLNGARGSAPADIEALKQAIVSLSRFAARHADDVAEIDINPLVVYEIGKGVVALDALIVPKNAHVLEASK